MLNIPVHAAGFLQDFQPVEAFQWHALDLLGLKFGGLYHFHSSSTKALIFTADFDIDIDGPGGNVTTDPCWQGETALRTAAGDSCDSRLFPGYVMSSVLKAFGAHIGDFGFCLWGNRRRAFQVYDIGPTSKAGEGSIFLARSLGIVPPSLHDRDAARGNFETVDDVVTVLFPSTAPGIGTPWPNHAIAPALIPPSAQTFWPTGI